MTGTPINSPAIEALIDAAAAENTMAGKGTLRNLAGAIRLTHGEGLRGAVCELGCHKGRTSLFMRQVLDTIGDDRVVFAYDSFKGLPKPTSEDKGCKKNLKEGSCQASLEAFKETTGVYSGSNEIIVVPGWFDDTIPQRLPRSISVAFLDSDWYLPLRRSLFGVMLSMQPGGFVIIHDYMVCSGARKLCNEASRLFKQSRTVGNLFIGRV